MFFKSFVVLPWIQCNRIKNKVDFIKISVGKYQSKHVELTRMPSIIWKYCKKWWIVPPPDLQQLFSVFHKCSRLFPSFSILCFCSIRINRFLSRDLLKRFHLDELCCSATMYIHDLWSKYYVEALIRQNHINGFFWLIICQLAFVIFTTAKHKSDRVHLAPKCSINIFCWYTSVFSSPDNLRAAWWEGIWGGDICRPIQCGGDTHTHLWHPRRWEYKSLFLINLWFLFSINFWFIFNKFLIHVFNSFINVICVLCRYLVETYYNFWV